MNSVQTNQLSSTSTKEIDLAALMRAVWQQRRLVSICVGVFILLGLLYLRLATFSYTTEFRVTPVQSKAGSGLSSQLGGLRGLASVAGFSLPGAEMTDFQLYLESLQSRSVADEISQNRELMQMLFPGEWDPKRQHWVQPRSALRATSRAVKRVLGLPIYPWQAPDGARVQEYLQSALEIEQKPEKLVVVIRMRSPNPGFSERLLTAVNQAADNEVRQKSLARAQEYIRYLSHQLETVQVAEHRLAIAQALSEQEKTRMMTSATTPFAAEPFGKPTSSLRATQPIPMVVLIVSIGLGLLTGMIAVVALNARHRPEA